MPNNDTTLTSREVGKSREYISGLVISIPEKFAEYRQLQTLADAEKNPNVKKVLMSGASGIFSAYDSQRNEVVTRCAEVLAKLATDSEKFAKFVENFLPYFQTQQEMVVEKQAK